MKPEDKPKVVDATFYLVKHVCDYFRSSFPDDTERAVMWANKKRLARVRVEVEPLARERVEAEREAGKWGTTAADVVANFFKQENKKGNRK